MAGTLRSRTPAPIVAAMVMMVMASCFFYACKSAPPAASISIHWATDTNQVVVEVQGLSKTNLEKLRNAEWRQPQWEGLFSIYSGSPDSPTNVNLPPMAGTYSVEATTLRFTPRFPMEPQAKYWAVFQPEQLPEGIAGTTEIISIFQPPKPQATSNTTVTQIYPSAEVLPENLLKFYVHFSAPMSRGNIYQHIQLLNSDGKEVELPFLEIDEELWDPAMTRLTLIIDPGRIKRGVRPLEDIGPVLEEGKSYTLRISRQWQDGTGNPLKESYAKTFRVGQADRETPDHKRWKYEIPKPETVEPLAVIFPEPMDQAVTQRVIQLQDSSGPVNGKISMQDKERRWTFEPENPWQRGPYRLLIRTTIEDLAGNNIGKPFDVDTSADRQKRSDAVVIKYDFKIE
jgi:hypothetical protein